jgi:aromatic ring-opening dioxygenase LigB subunit
MAQVVAGMASSHAYTFLDPTVWDKRRQKTRQNYASRYGVEPPEQPQVQQETLEETVLRFENIRQTLNMLKERLHALKPDLLVMIGDDQDENFDERNLPQFAVYVGGDFDAVDRHAPDKRYHFRSDSAVGAAILEQSIDAGFDLASTKRFENDALLSHAHREPLVFLDSAGSLPVLPIFINAIHVPAPTPARCFEFGRNLRRILDAYPENKRVVLYASGGLSHFTAGYPWPHYSGEFSVGSISVDFDRKMVSCMQAGQLSKLADLTSSDLLANGDVEFRQWLVLLGALGERKPDRIVYEPFYRGVLGMAAAYWELEAATSLEAKIHVAAGGPA